MKLGLRLLLGFFVITGIAAFFVLRVFVAEVKPSVREVMEDMLVDTANILAELARDDLAHMAPGATLAGTRFADAVRDYASRPIEARIWGLSKRTLDYRVYVTDAAGRVVFDSGFRDREGNGTGDLGRDYSRWNDVARTLTGQYGARSSREVATDESSSVMVVAAPIKQGDRLIGVLAVAKPTRTVQPFIDRAQREILIKGFWLMGLSLGVGLLVTGWIVWSVRRLRHYAQHVQLGQATAAPSLPGELGELAQAMEAMQQRLQGREHIEQLVRALTHELKSPLAAIGGAAELLHDELPASDRQALALQIQDQSARMRSLVERLLELSKLEHRRSLDMQGPCGLRACTQAAVQAASARAMQRGVTIMLQPGAEAMVQGEARLIEMAIGNLLDNAIDFSPAGATVTITVTEPGGDTGPVLADEVPIKGSGLGLAIVRQVMVLHRGGVEIEPARPGRVLRGRKAGVLFGGAIGAIYAALYLLLQMEQTALLLGSVLMFGVIAAVMTATRRMDWYALVSAPSPEPGRAATG